MNDGASLSAIPHQITAKITATPKRRSRPLKSRSKKFPHPGTWTPWSSSRNPWNSEIPLAKTAFRPHKWCLDTSFTQLSRRIVRCMRRVGVCHRCEGSPGSRNRRLQDAVRSSLTQRHIRTRAGPCFEAIEPCRSRRGNRGLSRIPLQIREW